MAGVEISAVLQRKERPAPAIELGGWPRPWIAARAWGVLAWIVPFLVYLRTLAPTIYGLDSVELTTGAYVLGIVHAPGSPLYLILGHLFTWLPVGDVGYRLNLMSACAAALTAYFIYRILLLLSRDRLVALATTWTLAFTYYVWVSAVAAEIYALHGTFVAGLLWLGLAWRQQGRPWQLVALALLFGLGLGNHLSLAVLAPGFAWLVLSAPSRPWRRPRLLLAAGAAGLVGACIYLYLPLRHLSNAPLDYARDYWRVNLATWDGFWWMVSGRMFDSLFWAVPAERLPAELLRYAHQLWSNFLGLGIFLGLGGLVADFRRRPAFHLALLLMFAAHLAFYLSYGAGDKELMFLPTYLIWGLWLGMGARILREQVARRAREEYHLVVPGTLLLLALSGLVLNFRYVDLSDDRSSRQVGEKILAAVDEEAWYFGMWGDIPVLEYLQLVEGQRLDVTPVNLIFTGQQEGARLAYEKLRAGYPVYTSARALPLPSKATLQHVPRCGCYRVVHTVQRNRK
ncbi:MAG TPA: DUF2723 domain-containing protein [Ardenticatenaceae bacterium]|nr:DUF2723 domain-containing protein [Ardenticatenaceae bacterium]